MYVNENTAILADFHCHTIASMHAYSTLRENIEAAKKKGLRLLAITDHAIGTADSPPLTYFENLTSLPSAIDGIQILRGVEANIMDYNGRLDMPAEVLRRLDFVIASFHTSCTVPGTVEDHTRAYIEIAKNPDVDMIGHSGTEEFRYDYEKVIPIFGKYGKAVEVNAHTFICRQKSVRNCIQIAQLCSRYGVPIMVNSDAHSEFEIGAVDKALNMLRQINFPEELIINTDEGRIQRYLTNLAAIY